MIGEIIQRAKENKKTIILPESKDERVLEAALYAQENGIADIILLGIEEDIYNLNPTIKDSGIVIINPLTYTKTNKIVSDLLELRKDKGLTVKEVEEMLIHNDMYFASMMVYEGWADGVVSGAIHSTSDTLRPALQILKGKNLVSAFFLMDTNDKTYLFADSGLIQNPNIEELASIAVESAKSYKLLLQEEAKVAMLSHSTYGSSNHPDVDKVKQATQIVKEKDSSIIVDGELQVDAAIVPEVAKIKCPDSPLKGEANTLIFPDLDAGNIGYKLVQRLANAKAYGPITQGLLKPVNDLSRGCTKDDIIGVIAITAVQANK